MGLLGREKGGGEGGAGGGEGEGRVVLGGGGGGSGPMSSQTLGAPQIQPLPLTHPDPSHPQKLRFPEAVCAVQWEESDVLWQ